MIKTKYHDLKLTDRLSVSRLELPKLLGCGQPTADKIAKDAGAKIYVGKKLLISIDKIRDYLNKNSQ